MNKGFTLADLNDLYAKIKPFYQEPIIINGANYYNIPIRNEKALAILKENGYYLNNLPPMDKKMCALFKDVDLFS